MYDQLDTMNDNFVVDELRQDAQKLAEQEQSERSSTCCPQAQIWHDKYIDLEARFTSLEKEISELRELKDVREVRSHFQRLYRADTNKANEIKRLKYKLDLLTNTIIRFEEKLQEANEKLLGMQTRSMR